MRKFVVLVLGAAGIAMVFLAAFRLLNGLDLLTGDDPRTMAAEKANPQLRIAFVPESRSLFEVVDPVRHLKGYIELSEGEALSGFLQIGRCPDTAAAGEIGRYPAGSDRVCILAATDAGDRRHVSFAIRPEAIDEAWAFHEAELAKLPSSSGGSHRESGPRWRSAQFVSDLDTGRRVSVRYHYDPPYHGPLVSILDTGLR